MATGFFAKSGSMSVIEVYCQGLQCQYLFVPKIIIL
jgi:hypothetical protein